MLNNVNYPYQIIKGGLRVVFWDTTLYGTAKMILYESVYCELFQS